MNIKKIKLIQKNLILKILLTFFLTVVFLNTSCAEDKEVPLTPSISSEKLDLNKNQTPSFFHQFTDKKLNVAVYEEAPFVFRSNETDRYKGIAIDLWEAIAHKNGLTFFYTSVTKEDGIKGILEGKYDLLLGAIPNFIQQDDMKFDNTTPFYVSGMGLAIAQKSLVAILFDYFFSLNTLKIVCLIILFILLQGTTIWFFERKKNEDFKNTKNNKWKGIGNGIWWSINIVSLCDIGDVVTKTFSGRAMATVWLFLTLITMNVFVGSISSELTIEKMSSQIYSLKDIEGLNILCLEDSFSQQFLKNNAISYKKILSLEDGLKILSKDHTKALVYSEPVLRYMMKEHPTKGVKFVPAGVLSQYFSFMLPQKSPLLYRLNQEILEFLEKEEIKKIVEKYLGSDYRCNS